MKHISPSYDIALATVRHISETATTSPAPRKLHTCRVRSHIIKDVPVFQPWRDGQTFWKMP